MMSNGELIPSVINPLIQDPYSNPTIPNPNTNPSKRKRNLPGTPDPDAEVIGLSPKSLMATNRFVCEICNKGFQRDQNLQLHKRGHNLPWKLKQRNSNEVVRKKVYICPEKSCVHHEPSRALGDLTGIKKHYSRKHGEKKWKCDKCSKKYAVKSDWKAHSKICGTREYKCDCGTLFSRKDSFTTHRAFCDALVEESARFTTPLIPSASLNQMLNVGSVQNGGSSDQFSGVFRQEIGGFDHDSGNVLHHQFNLDPQKSRFPLWLDNANHHQLNGNYPSSSRASFLVSDELSELGLQQNQWLSRGQEESFVGGGVLKAEDQEEENKRNLSEKIINSSNIYYSNGTNPAAAPMSATALLQKAAQIGSSRSGGFGVMSPSSFSSTGSLNSFKRASRNEEVGVEGEMNGLTRDFLGVGGREKHDFFAAMAMSRYKGNE